jgi:hypothetical protein
MNNLVTGKTASRHDDGPPNREATETYATGAAVLPNAKTTTASLPGVTFVTTNRNRLATKVTIVNTAETPAIVVFVTPAPSPIVSVAAP